MNLKIYSQPASECVSLSEAKDHLRLDSGDFGDNLTTVQMIAPASQSVTVGYTLTGAYADVLGVSALISLDAGTVGTSGTVDCKIQDSDDHVTWADWVGGGFTQVTAANDNAIQKLAYTGNKQYVRVVAKILVATCSFGVACLKYASDATEDSMLSGWITAARQKAESITRRAFITQTWDLVLDAWPGYDFRDKSTRTAREIMFPFGNLQSVTSVAYTNDLGESTALTATTDYLVDTFSEPGRLVLPPGGSWPSSSLYSLNPIMIRFTCGYGGADSVPFGIKAAIKMMAADMYRNREAKELPIGGAQRFIENQEVSNLLANHTLRSWG